MSAIETLPTGGETVRLRIESVIYSGTAGDSPAVSADSRDGVTAAAEAAFAADDGYPRDIEEAALAAMDAQAAVDDGPLRTELVTEGKYSFASGRITVTYDESELLQSPGTLTSITFKKSEPKLIAIVRTGALDGMLVLEEGRRHICEYNVGFMKLPVTLYASRVHNTVSRGRGTLELEYTVEMNGGAAQRARMKITVGGDTSADA